MTVALTFTGARWLAPEGWRDGPLAIDGGLVAEAPEGRAVDLAGWWLLPGIIDVHGDGFERHVAVRRGALTSIDHGLEALEAELAANGITTAVLAQFWSWEGGMRGPDFARRLVDAWQRVAPRCATDLRLQLRLETSMIDSFAEAEALIAEAGIGQVVLSDHLPHDRLAEGRTPPRLAGQALKSGRSPEAHRALMQALHARRAEVPAAVTALVARLLARGVGVGSHDDATPEARAAWRARGVRLSEFPETLETAAAAKAAGDLVVMGAPNVVRGASHAGKVSAREVVAAGHCDALASDYHYPAPRHAARALAEAGITEFGEAWRLVSEGPAAVLGLADRGRLAPGLRADLVALDAATGRIGASFVAGRASYLTTPLAERFLA